MLILELLFYMYLSLQTQCSYGDPDSLEFALDGRMYELEYQMVDGDMDPPEYALAGADFSGQGEQYFTWISEQ